ncbi:MAG: hypothetical protein Tsb0020_44250 [Haliangiales bacterium]
MQFRSVFKMFALAASLSLLVACGGDDGPSDPPMSILGDCPSGADTTVGQTVFDNNCAACHAGFNDASTRSGSPVNMAACTDGDSIADCMYQRAMGMSMPPDPNTKLTADEVEDLRVWLACTQ